MYDIDQSSKVAITFFFFCFQKIEIWKKGTHKGKSGNFVGPILLKSDQIHVL